MQLLAASGHAPAWLHCTSKGMATLHKQQQSVCQAHVGSFVVLSYETAVVR